MYAFCKARISIRVGSAQLMSSKAKIIRTVAKTTGEVSDWSCVVFLLSFMKLQTGRSV